MGEKTIVDIAVGSKEYLLTMLLPAASTLPPLPILSRSPMGLQLLKPSMARKEKFPLKKARLYFLMPKAEKRQ